MECRNVLESAVDELTGELSHDEAEELRLHLATCESCRGEVAAMQGAWRRLGQDADVVPSPAFRARTLELLAQASETARTKGGANESEHGTVVPFRPRRVAPALLRIAAVVVAAAGGFAAARLSSGGATPAPVTASPVSFATTTERLPVVAQRTLDVTKTLPDLGSKPRLANVAFRPADAAGRIGVSFDVTTRYTLVGKPEDKGIADLMAYLLTGAAETEGTRGKAIDLVSRHYADGSTPSPQVVEVLGRTLKTDKNPGVRRKAAEALVQLPQTKETQTALMDALKTDTNPAVRILAVEGLAKGAKELKDPTTIQTLREKASDEGENGYVRSQAALALRGIDL